MPHTKQYGAYFIVQARNARWSPISTWGIIHVNMQDIKSFGAAYRGVPKRLLDIIISLFAIALTALPMLVCALAVYAESGGPVIFRQWRMGTDRRPFICFKFRTMTNDAPHSCATAELHSPERYITRVGAVLRATSLDELPQLFNVLRGDMSLIGPRPVICEESELIGLRASLGVYNIRPGMTGLAQVRGRDSVSIRRKAAYDAQYMEHMSLSLDARLLWRTLINVVNRSDIRDGAVDAGSVGDTERAESAGDSGNIGNAEDAGISGSIGNAENAGGIGNAENAGEAGSIGNAENAGEAGSAGSTENANGTGNTDGGTGHG